MKSKGLIRKERIIEYLDNIERQLKDIRSIPIPGKDFFLNRENSIQIKAIKYSLACAIQDIIHISAHIASTLSLWKVRETEAEAILALAEEEIIPKEFAEKIKGMPSFRNRFIHDYLPNEFDAEKLYESLQDLDDFKEFSRFVLDWISKKD